MANPESIPTDTVRFTGRGDVVAKLLELAKLSRRGAENKLGGDSTSWSKRANGKRGIFGHELRDLAVVAGVDPNLIISYAVGLSVQQLLPDLNIDGLPEVREKIKEVLDL